jgi:NADH:ubiquinone reductase (H+-translocating)
MADIKRIVILGGGYGGVHAAKLLNKKYKKNDNVEITLIDKKPYHTLLTEIHEVAGNRIEPDGVQVSFDKIFSGKRVKVVIDNITSIDFDNRVLTSEDYTYSYDYLVMGTGSEPAYFGVPGVEENGFTLWSLEDALKIKEHIINMFEKASVERDKKKREAMLTFIVAGAGFTGMEMAGELAEFKKKLCFDYKIKEYEVKLMVVEAMDNILPILNEKLQKKSVAYLWRKGVKILTNSAITEVSENAITLKNGSVIPTKTLIWTCGVQNNGFATSLGLSSGRANRNKVNEYMQSVDHANVYIVGDNCHYEETSGSAIPQIVETALQTAEAAVKNIVADIAGKEKEAFKSNYHGFMVSLGSKYAVAQFGNISLSGFLATIMKHLVNLHYLLGVAGLNAMWAYIAHEFFDTRENRSLLGGHLSRKSHTIWLVLLRVFIGTMWLLEGVKKVKDGWLNPDNIYIIQVSGVTGATEQAETVAEALLSSPPAIYTWFMETFIERYAFLFQASVVLMEIAIGLALIAGLFTFLASLGSIFLCVNFILSAMAGVEIFWYIFGSIALMGGAGRAFGLDYYVMPWIKKIWNKTIIAKKTYLYIDEPTVGA